MVSTEAGPSDDATFSPMQLPMPTHMESEPMADEALSATVAALREMSEVREVTSVMRVEGDQSE